MQKQKQKRWVRFLLPITAVVSIGVFAALALVRAGPARAATGINQQLNYQARLLTSTGAVVPDGLYNIEFKIYQDGDGVIGGGDETLKWTETRESGNKIQVKNGYFSVYLGSVTAFGSNVDWNQDTLWLTINIGGTGSPTYNGEMSPFTRLSSTPYALNSRQLGGLSSGQFVQLAQGVQAENSTTASSIFINKTGITANILQLQRGGNNVLLVDNAGTALFRTETNSTTALRLQNSSNNSLLTASTDTSAPVLTVSATASSSQKGLIVNNSTSTGNIAEFQDNGTPVLTIADGGTVTIDGSLAVNGGTIAANGTITLNTTGTANTTIGNTTGVLALVSNALNVTGAGAVTGVTTLNASGTITAPTFSGNATTATAFAANPDDCSANQFANAIAADGDLTCAAITDADVSNTLTASIFVGSGSSTNAVDLGTAEIAGTLADGNVSDSITVDWTGLQNYPTGCSAGQAVSAVGDTLTCSTFNTDASISLQDAYGQGNTISTSGSSIGFTLNSSDAFTVATAASGTSSTTFSLTNGSNASAPAQLVLITNNDTNESVAAGLKVTSATGTIVSALDASGSNITNALSIGSNNILTSGATISAAELNLLDTHNVALVDIDDGVNTAITGTGVLGSGSISTGFGAIDVGTETITTTGTIGTAGTTTFTGNTGTFSGAIAANGGITFNNSSDTLGAFTLAGTLDANTNILTNIGNTGTDFIAGTGALTLAGVLTANNGITVTGDSTVTGNFDVSGTLNVGTSDAFKINADGDVTGTMIALNGTSTANGGSGLGSSTNLVLTSAANFDVGNYVQMNSNNCGGTGINPCYAKITAKATNTLTIAPALTWTTGATVNEYHIPEIGGANTTNTLANRYGRGYFISGVATGNGTTFYGEDSIDSSLQTFNLLNTGVTTLNIGGAATTLSLGTSGTTTTIAGTVNFTGNITAPATGTSGYFQRSGTTLTTSNSGDTITTTGTIGTASTTTFTGNTGTFSGAIAANGGITFNDATDTLGAFTLAGTLDANANILTNIGNTGTDFIASTGALTLAGVLTANGGVGIAANQNIALASGTGTFSQIFTGTTTTAATITADSLTSGKALSVASASAGLTGNLVDITLSGNMRRSACAPKT